MPDWKEFLAPRTSPEHTHLLLNGGKLNVPDDKHSLFLRIYAKALENGERVYVVERRRKDIFRMMIDFDGVFEEKLTQEMRKGIAKTIQQIVYKLYDIDFNVISLIAPPVKKADSGWKCGIHFIWPRLFVSSEIALAIRQEILAQFTMTAKCNNAMDDVFDPLVYTRNGFRMVGSDKWNHKTRRGENRVYGIDFVMDSEGNMREAYADLLRKNTFRMVQDTSIREIFGNTAKTIPLPNVKLANVPAKNRKLVRRNEDLSALEDFLRSSMPKGYVNVNVKGLREYPDGNFLVITDSKYCLNLRRNHSSCGIYFLLTARGVYQKCLCPCKNLKGRKFGYCHEFTSKLYPIDDFLKELYFGKKYIFSGTQSKGKQIKKYEKFVETLFDNI